MMFWSHIINTIILRNTKIVSPRMRPKQRQTSFNTYRKIRNRLKIMKFLCLIVLTRLFLFARSNNLAISSVVDVQRCENFFLLKLSVFLWSIHYQVYRVNLEGFIFIRNFDEFSVTLWSINYSERRFETDL